MPAIHAAEPAEPNKRLIPILTGPATAAPARPQHVDPWAFWKEYYESGRHRPSGKNVKDPDLQELKDLCETLRLLNVNRKHADVQAALSAYMIYRPRMVEPWMYLALAESLKLNGGRPADVKKYLGYAAGMAIKGDNPNDLVSTADMLMVNGYYDAELELPDRRVAGVGPLLDKACQVVPHQYAPPLMSANLALKTKDPKRMADAVEKLLSLGWPGRDEAVRGKARELAELLARTLREEGRASEARDLLARVSESESRDLFVSLTWLGDADLDLVVEEPEGVSTARYRSPRTVFGGSIVRNGYGKHPREIYVCPRAFDGEYTIRIETIYNNPDKPASDVKLEVITHEGSPKEHKEEHAIKLGSTLTEPIVVKMTGGRRKTLLPFLAPRGDIPVSATKPQKDAEKTKGTERKPVPR